MRAAALAAILLLALACGSSGRVTHVAPPERPGVDAAPVAMPRQVPRPADLPRFRCEWEWVREQGGYVNSYTWRVRVYRDGVLWDDFETRNNHLTVVNRQGYVETCEPEVK